MEFLRYTIKWIASNLAIPFWVVGHVHLTMNVYEDIYEILASFGLDFGLSGKIERKVKSYL